MDSHEGGTVAFDVAANERDVLVVIDIARIRDHAEIAEASGEDGFGEAAHVTFVLHAIANQIRDGEQFQIVFFAEFDELRHAGHCAVLAHNFADDAGGSESGDTR